MKRFFLDSNVYDEFLRNHELLELVLDAQAQGLLELIGSHIEPDEHRATISNNPNKGSDLVSAHRVLDVRQVSTEGLVLGKSRIGGANLFDDADVELFIKQTAANPDHQEDILMILTAKREEATFVTEEKSEIHAFAEKSVSNVSMPKV
ncbi:MAG: hypothetical protein Q8L08_08375 [Candidatus Nanopelagicaceae bacterium]|nr:hypothetical protein [Candidatus Nanopelagicaceae bacterium]